MSAMSEGGIAGTMDGRTRLIFRISCWASGITIISIFVYAIVASLITTGTGYAIGSVLVNVFWPLPFFAQPVTYLSISSVAFFYSALRLWEERISKWPQHVLSFIQLLGFVIAFASGYEVMYNFMLWGALYSVDYIQQIRDPNFIITPTMIPWNLVFATKIFSALFVISGYTVYFIRRLNKSGLV